MSEVGFGKCANCPRVLALREQIEGLEVYDDELIRTAVDDDGALEQVRELITQGAPEHSDFILADEDIVQYAVQNLRRTSEVQRQHFNKQKRELMARVAAILIACDKRGPLTARFVNGNMMHEVTSCESPEAVSASGERRIEPMLHKRTIIE